MTQRKNRETRNDGGMPEYNLGVNLKVRRKWKTKREEKKDELGGKRLREEEEEINDEDRSDAK